jgi:hypothetical protein
MNALESVTSKICSAREILNCAIEAHEDRNHSKVETLIHAVDEFLVYYLQEFDDKFKEAWKSTVGDLREGDIVDDGMRPWGHSDLEYSIVNNKKSLACDKDDPSPECQGAWNDFWEEHYYPEEIKIGNASSIKIDGYSVNGHGHSDHYYDYTRNDPNRRNPFSKEELDKEVEEIRKAGGYEWTPEVKQDKVTKWILPVEETKIAETDEIEYFVSFPDDLLEASDLKEGDQVEWVDQGDGSYLIRKATKPLRMDEC